MVSAMAVQFSSIRKQRAFEQVLEQIVGLISAGELKPLGIEKVGRGNAERLGKRAQDA